MQSVTEEKVRRPRYNGLVLETAEARLEFQKKLFETLVKDNPDLKLEDIPNYIVVTGQNRKQRRHKVKLRCKRRRLIRGKVYKGE